MRNRISSRSLILSFLVHLFYKKVGLDPYSNQFTGSFQRSTHNKSLIDGAQCSKFWFVIHGMTDFKQRNDFIFNAFPSGFHFVMKALKIHFGKTSEGQDLLGNGKPLVLQAGLVVTYPEICAFLLIFPLGC